MHPSQQVVDLRTLKAALSAWVREATRLNAVWTNQNAPQPDWPYATMRIVSIAQDGGPDFGLLTYDSGDDILTNSTVGFKNVTVSVQFFVGPPDDADPDCDANAHALTAIASLFSDKIRNDFRTANIAVIGTTAVNDIETLVDSQWVSRSSFDVSVRVSSSYTEELSIIESAEITGTVKRPDDSEITVGPFDAP